MYNSPVLLKDHPLARTGISPGQHQRRKAWPRMRGDPIRTSVSCKLLHTRIILVGVKQHLVQARVYLTCID